MYHRPKIDFELPDSKEETFQLRANLVFDLIADQLQISYMLLLSMFFILFIVLAKYYLLIFQAQPLPSSWTDLLLPITSISLFLYWCLNKKLTFLDSAFGLSMDAKAMQEIRSSHACVKDLWIAVSKLLVCLTVYQFFPAIFILRGSTNLIYTLSILIGTTIYGHRSYIRNKATKENIETSLITALTDLIEPFYIPGGKKRIKDHLTLTHHIKSGYILIEECGIKDKHVLSMSRLVFSCLVDFIRESIHPGIVLFENNKIGIIVNKDTKFPERLNQDSFSESLATVSEHIRLMLKIATLLGLKKATIAYSESIVKLIIPSSQIPPLLQELTKKQAIVSSSESEGIKIRFTQAMVSISENNETQLHIVNEEIVEEFLQTQYKLTAAAASPLSEHKSSAEVTIDVVVSPSYGVTLPVDPSAFHLHRNKQWDVHLPVTESNSAEKSTPHETINHNGSIYVRMPKQHDSKAAFFRLNETEISTKLTKAEDDVSLPKIRNAVHAGRANSSGTSATGVTKVHPGEKGFKSLYKLRIREDLRIEINRRDAKQHERAAGIEVVFSPGAGIVYHSGKRRTA